MILAGDIGGTKTNLALFDPDGENYTFKHLKTYHSQEYANLRTIVKNYIESSPVEEITMACFAIAGPVSEGVCRATNLPWVVDAKVIAKECSIPKVFLINDLEANAYAIDILPKEQLQTLHPGKEGVRGNRCVVSPGTGLGEAGLYWDGQKYHPFACEGGHAEFGPRDELQIDLCRYLYQRFGHASYERILSGPGILNLYQFFVVSKSRSEPQWLTEEMREKDPSAVITENALNKKSELCVDVLNLFVSILGSESGNCALKFMALGGVYLGGGGIPPKIISKLHEPFFFEGFVDKGRFREMLSNIPIHIILDDKAALRGSARYCRIQEKRLVF